MSAINPSIHQYTKHGYSQYINQNRDLRMDPEAELNHMLSSRNPLWDLPGGPLVKNLSYNTGDIGSIPDQGTNSTGCGAT